MTDFLVEIHTEELPPKSLYTLATYFSKEIQARLTKEGFFYGEVKFFATPRRLAVLIKNLQNKQADTQIERKGPALVAAYDASGSPTPACVGFARSCNVSTDELFTIKNSQGEWVGYIQKVLGKTIQEIAPVIVTQALAALPVAKKMRWGNTSVEFVRPIHSVILLYGKEIISATILGVETNRKTRGHRFHSKDWITITEPINYEKKLAEHFVLADFEMRKEKIRQQIIDCVNHAVGEEAHAVIQEELLDEVTSLVEWPVALCGQFDQRFLAVPQEALISSMQDHQRYFPVVDLQNKLLPYFITISHIESKDPTRIIRGNERVLCARLSDAAFFFTVDKKQKLIDRVDALKNSVFQNKLGTLYDKAERIALLTAKIASHIKIDEAIAKRAGLLAKADLTTQLVGEFPELQGTAGYYYALHDGEPETLANALREHYLPRFSGDALPTTLLGCAVALSDRLDTLVGVFGIQQAPTGDKDPFGLRRAALGILRILIEKELNFDLKELLQAALKNYHLVKLELEDTELIQTILSFMMERLKPWYQEQNISSDIFAAVTALNITKPYDIHRRIKALQLFKKSPEAEALSIANKRISQILNKYTEKMTIQSVNPDLFKQEAERLLAKKIQELDAEIAVLKKSENYSGMLIALAKLREPIDLFFDKVMVMVDDKTQRENRLLLLKKLRELFLSVADMALLQ
jgi:glycyl-tRNA synthetase beta chain